MSAVSCVYAIQGQGEICPTEALKKLTSFKEIANFLFSGANSPFGKFTPSEETCTKDGQSWRLFEAENGKKTILLESIVNQINGLNPAERLYGRLTGGEGSKSVTIIKEEGFNQKYARNLYEILSFLNTYSIVDSSIGPTFGIIKEFLEFPHHFSTQEKKSF